MSIPRIFMKADLNGSPMAGDDARLATTFATQRKGLSRSNVSLSTIVYL
jgi:hypothetical protein